MTMIMSVALLSAAAIDPAHKESLTVYHLNPKVAGVIPVNMDTGNARGDLYFYLGQFLLPLECANITNHSMSGFDCDNPERRDPSLVVTEVDMEVDTRFTNYSACNLCNGTDPFTGKSCELGTYVCDCFHQGGNITCDGTKVGSENVTTAFSHHTKPECKKALDQMCPFTPGPKEDPKCDSCVKDNARMLEKEYNCTQSDFWRWCPGPTSCSPGSEDWTCWRENIVRKTGGMWYSTMKEGQCMDDSSADCGWRVKATKTVNETCMHESIVDTLRDYSPDCFKGCPQPRNESSACFIGCFFDALLGPQARNSSDVALSGIPLSKLEAGWTRAFNGHCPLI
eukprot:Hpha_TRINITY_DN16620_c1_g1::TRINITY_DN16620_c1_g1_i1::g.179093::m.179093